jgi:hypothetical protein
MALGRKTGGRARGTKNKASTAREQAIAESGLTPLDYMLDLMRTAENPAIRFEAAKAAAPYIHPRLANVDVGNRDGKPFQMTTVETDKKLL